MNEPLCLSLIGIGNVRCAVPILASLARYFGERPLVVRFWDPEFERADLFWRLGRALFTFAEAPHECEFIETAEEALDGADFVVVSFGENAARKWMNRKHGDRESALREAATRLSGLLPGVPTLDLGYPPTLEGAETLAGWPGPIEPLAETLRPHQVLRWIRGDEYPHDLLEAYDQSPLKAWLDALWAVRRTARDDSGA